MSHTPIYGLNHDRSNGVIMNISDVGTEKFDIVLKNVFILNLQLVSEMLCQRLVYRVLNHLFFSQHDKCLVISVLKMPKKKNETFVSF